MTDQLTQVSGSEFRRLWPSIVEKVREVHAQERDPGYLVEDVYAEVMAGEALFFRCADGFVVLNTIRNPYNDARDLNVWIAASNDVEHGVIARHKDELTQIAQHFGCSRVTFRTTRKGFERICSTHGMELTEYSFAWRVSDVEKR